MGGSFGVNYYRDLNCYFKIEVSTGKKVKITFKNDFDLQNGVDYGIGPLYPAYSLTNANGEF